MTLEEFLKTFVDESVTVRIFVNNEEDLFDSRRNVVVDGKKYSACYDGDDDYVFDILEKEKWEEHRRVEVHKIIHFADSEYPDVLNIIIGEE